MTNAPATRDSSRDIRLVVADVDGALLSPGKVLTPRARAAVDAVIKAGIAPNANKGEVGGVLSGLLAIPAPQIATVGDMPNDVLMFERSGTSIAMANASADVQGAATFVTASNTEEGFAVAMERFVLRAAAA